MRPAALVAAVPVLALWAAAPLVAHALSRPVPERRLALGPADRALFEGIARDTWRYFEAFMGPEDHGLPADNFQETPEPRVAHRTSPTNIGMGLLATLAAHDLGFIATGRARPEDRRDPHDDGGRSSGTRATCSTGTTRGAWRRSRPATSRRSTAGTWRAR